MKKCIFIISFFIIFINNLISQNIDKIQLENGKYILRLSDSISPYNNFTNLSNQNILKFKNENKTIFINNDIKEIDINNGAKVKITDTLKADSLYINIDNASYCEMLIFCNKLEINIDNASNLIIKGLVKDLKITANESSYINAADLSVWNAIATTDKAAKINIKAVNQLNLFAQGTSIINYFGTSNNINIEKSAASDVTLSKKKIDEKNDSLKLVKYFSIINDQTLNDTINNEIVKSETPKVEDEDIIMFGSNNRKSKDKSEKFSGSWLAFGLLYTNYGQSPLSFSLPDKYDDLSINFNKSIGFQFNFLQISFSLSNKKNWGLVTGLGLQWVNYILEKTGYVVEYDDGIHIEPENNIIIDVNIEQTKLSAFYLEIPLLLELKTKSKLKMDVSFGLVYGFQLFNYYKLKLTSEIVDNKGYNLASFNKSKTGLIFKIDIDHIGCMIQYNFSNLFKPNKGPVVNPVEIGLIFSI
ncbi:MAG: DUF2807 domain-containing protein [Bacteroidales bacterium]|nr:DUF2807 domain-containing protein [Bacteroidales bacterium]